MACLELVIASSLRAAFPTLPVSRSSPWETCCAFCIAVGDAPWPLRWTGKTYGCYKIDHTWIRPYLLKSSRHIPTFFFLEAATSRCISWSSETWNFVTFNDTVEITKCCCFFFSGQAQTGLPQTILTDREEAYLALIPDTSSVIWPSALAVPRISLRSFPAHSSPTFPASSRIWRIACSPASPEGATMWCRIISEQFKRQSDGKRKKRPVYYLAERLDPWASSSPGPSLSWSAPEPSSWPLYPFVVKR